MRENSKVKITIRPVPYASLRKHGLLEMHDPGGRSRRSPQNTICLYSPERLIFPKGCPMGMNSTANTSWKKSLRCSICSIRKDIAAAACQWVMLWNWGGSTTSAPPLVSDASLSSRAIPSARPPHRIPPVERSSGNASARLRYPRMPHRIQSLQSPLLKRNGAWSLPISNDHAPVRMLRSAEKFIES